MTYRDQRVAGAAEPAPTDEELMLRARGGDSAAFGELVGRYEKPVFGYLRRMLGSREEAADLFQETFLRVYAHRGRYRAGAPFRPWLYRIATNVGRDRLRYMRRRPVVPLALTPEAPVANGKAGPAEHAREREFEERLQAALAELPVKQRAVFLMARYEGMPYDEIGRALRIPVGTVKSRMNKAVHFLMKQLREFLP